MEVLIRNLQNRRVNLAKLRKTVTRSLQAEGFERPAEVSVLLADDAQIHSLNRKYRGVDRPTDVLAFPQLEGEELPSVDGDVVLGDIILSVETAERQAAERGQSLDDEIALLAVHGTLHLLGYDDRTEAGAAEMRSHERRILGQSEDGGADRAGR